MQEERRQLEVDVYKYQAKVYQDMHEMAGAIRDVEEDVAQLKKGHASIQYTLNKHATQRAEGNKKLEDKLDTLLTNVKSIEEQTDEHGDFISKVKKYWVRITFTGAGILLTLGSLYWLYTFLEEHGLVIILEKA